MTAAPEPAGLYIHVPFCRSICPYCDFAVRLGREGEGEAFAEAVAAEMRLCSGWTHPFDTLYLGGGTPSMLPPRTLGRILDTARAVLPLLPDAQVSMEANPEDVSGAAVAEWRAMGVDAVSLGVQSFDPGELAFLGRGHDPAQARRATDRCTVAFDWVSVDLIFGLPGQPAGRWRRSLDAVAGLGVPHASCYQLTVHERTAFGRRRRRGELAETGGDAQAALYAITHETLAGAGLPAYEVSNFAAGPAVRSRHNQKYWKHVPYLGLGPSAHSFDGRRRWWNHRQLPRYRRVVGEGARPVAGGEMLDDATLALEALMLGLRLAEGIDLAAYRDRFDIDLVARNAELVGDLLDREFIRVEEGRLAPTVRGLAVADALAARLEL